MEDTKPYTSSTDNVSFPLQFLRPRHVPDVPEDIDTDFVMQHLNDPNIDLKRPFRDSTESLELADKKSSKFYDPSEIDSESDRYSTDRAESRNSTAVDFDDESPYPEVRAAVSSVDDPTIPVNTIRMWFLGIFFTCVVTGLNQFFGTRYPSVYITGIVVQLVSLPFGKLLERILPTYEFNTFGYRWTLNPGPFTIKEHVCITIMANLTVSGAYATDIIASQIFFYNQQLTYAYKILLVLGSQILGFSLGGMLRQFVVWPSSMIWPGALVNSALFNTLHKNYGKRDRGHMTRERFFILVVVGSFVWYWVPGYLFTALSVFNWACWIAPNNVVVNALFGTNTGLGMGILTFDWSMISYIGSPLVTPWWSELNTIIALVLMFWIVAPAIYFSNTFFTAFLPISSYLSFDNTGAPYDPTQVVTDGFFDVDKYHAYSPVFIPATLAVAYACAFAAFTAVFVHTFLWFGRDIARRFRASLKDERDVHSRLMQAYPEVPLYWYGIVGVIAMVFLLISIHLFPTQLPVWAALLAFFFAVILSVPMSMLQAITNQQVGNMQVIHELIAGYVLPERPIANMVFKCVAYIGTNQAVMFAGDLKLGHYMKIPPRVMFACQVVASVVSCFVVVTIQDLMFANIEDICTPNQKDGFICPGTNTFAAASLIWGGVGPQRMFSPGMPYNSLLWFYLIGAILPIPFYLLARRFPLSFWRYINIPVFFAGVGAIPPASGINYASWALAGFIFNYFMRRFHFRWWMRYNYILSAGLDAGVAIGLVVIFFTVMLPKGGIELNWWGNTVWMNTADANGMPFKVSETGTFGPSTWA
ncbi:OPT oligopeptide transporter [Dendrothele bispora CBS 962.96]|uniref:OPT oligopeptide transporter n=1 Tax=Dendrothele bispora (strain CBS 962.96) TaxID=1314807 RepID=A0A4S8LQE2_DENBC|nr:OPT oligopeptide transporter [Dendrothele bispora CBS 962.96]